MHLRLTPLSVGLFALICLAGFVTAPPAQTQTIPPPKADGQQTKFRYWTSSWSFQEIDLRDLATKLASIGVELPVEISGTASVNFDVSIPLNGLQDAKAYKFRGSLSSPRLKADEVALEDFAANVSYQDGIVRLTDLRGKQNGGSFQGSATADVASKGPFEAALTMERFDLGPVAMLVAKFGIGRSDRLPRGFIDGQVDLSGTLSNLRDVSSWQAAGQLHFHDITVGDSIPYSIAILDLTLRDGRLVISDARIESSALPEFFLHSNADIQLSARQAFTIAIQGNDIPATDLVGLYFESPESLLSGKLDLQGTATGELNPANAASPTFDVQLALASPSVHVLGVDFGLLEHRLRLTADAVRLEPIQAPDASRPLTIESLHAVYEIEPQRFQVKQLAANVFGGSISGNGEWARTADGVHRIDSRWSGLRPRFRLPWIRSSSPMYGSAETTGSVQCSVPTQKVAFPAFYRANIAVRLDPLMLGSELLGSVGVELKIDEAGLDLRGESQMFGGRIELTSNSPLDPNLRWTEVPKLLSGGQLLLTDVSIDRLIETFVEKNPRRVSGRISGKTDLMLDQDHGIESRSVWIVRDLAVDGQLLSRRLDADVSNRGSRIDVRSIRGSYAGGQVQVFGQWSLEGGSRLLDARVVHVEGDQMLLPLHSSANQWVSGKVSGRASIIGQGQDPLDDFRINGAVRLSDGRSFDIPLGNAHAPFRVIVKRDPLSWRVDFSNVRSELAQGQVDGDLRFASSGGSRRGFTMDSRWRMHHVEFASLLKTYAHTQTFGSGVVNGRFALSGRNVRTLDDLEGEFRMTLGSTDATAVPGVSGTSSLLGAVSLLGTKFNQGVAAGRISRGGVTFEQFVLLSDRLKVISSGRVGLRDGRMNMVTIATTGNLRGQNRVVEQIAPNAMLSISPLSSLNQLVSDRTVIADVVGTLRAPQIQLRPAETLQANSRDFLVRQLTGRLALESAVLGIHW